MSWNRKSDNILKFPCEDWWSTYNRENTSSDPSKVYLREETGTALHKQKSYLFRGESCWTSRVGLICFFHAYNSDVWLSHSNSSSVAAQDYTAQYLGPEIKLIERRLSPTRMAQQILRGGWIWRLKDAIDPHDAQSRARHNCLNKMAIHGEKNISWKLPSWHILLSAKKKAH